jgi:molybdopterin molybdotransferase
VRRGLDPEEEVPLVAIDEHRARILGAVGVLDARRVAIGDALGCVLATDVTAPRDLPPFASSAMDGYAVRSADVAAATDTAPARLRVVGEVAMGRAATAAVDDGEPPTCSTKNS